MRSLAILLAGCAALVAPACDVRHQDGPGASMSIEAVRALPLLPTAERVLDTPHGGVRRVEIHAGQASPVLAFREQVIVAGDGRFGLEPLEALSPVPQDWIFRAHLWARYSFRYREFAIRDLDLFLRNWRLVDLGQEVVVAGRTCARYDVERKVAPAKRYELAVDVETGLLLRAVKLDASGALLSVSEYESFDPHPDLASAVWTQSQAEERELDPAAELGAQLGFDVPLPQNLPEGFELLEAGTARYQDRDWLRLVYGDGVESVFFLRTLSSTPAAPGAAASRRPAGSSPDDRLVSARIGSVQVVQAVVADELMMGVGEVGEEDLVDLVESALP